MIGSTTEIKISSTLVKPYEEIPGSEYIDTLWYMTGNDYNGYTNLELRGWGQDPCGWDRARIHVVGMGPGSMLLGWGQDPCCWDGARIHVVGMGPGSMLLAGEYNFGMCLSWLQYIHSAESWARRRPGNPSLWVVHCEQLSNETCL